MNLGQDKRVVGFYKNTAEIIREEIKKKEEQQKFKAKKSKFS